MQRRKGGEYEREVARMLRSAIGEPEVEDAAALKRSRVKRGQQGNGAVEPDVRVEGLPIWFECQHADRPTPEAKLSQALNDLLRSQRTDNPVAVAVVRKTGARDRGRDTAYLYLGGFVELHVLAGMLPKGADKHEAFLGASAVSIVSVNFVHILNVVAAIDAVQRDEEHASLCRYGDDGLCIGCGLPR